MDLLPSILKMKDAENPNLVWITETSGGKKVVRTEETTEVVTNTNTVEVNENEQKVTMYITKTIVKKTLSTLNNSTT